MRALGASLTPSSDRELNPQIGSRRALVTHGGLPHHQPRGSLPSRPPTSPTTPPTSAHATMGRAGELLCADRRLCRVTSTTGTQTADKSLPKTAVRPAMLPRSRPRMADDRRPHQGPRQIRGRAEQRHRCRERRPRHPRHRQLRGDRGPASQVQRASATGRGQGVGRQSEQPRDPRCAWHQAASWQVPDDVAFIDARADGDRQGLERNLRGRFAR